MDLYDKLVAAITFVIFTFFCIINTFCFASTEVLPFSINAWSTNGSVLVENENRTFFQYNVTPGVLYTFNFSSPISPIIVLKNDDGQEMGLGDPVIQLHVASGTSSYTFTCPDNVNVIGLVYGISNASVSDVKLINENGSVMDSVIGSLVDNVGPGNIWEIFENSVPYIGVVILVAFGFYWIFHTIKEVSKAKEKMN